MRCRQCGNTLLSGVATNGAAEPNGSGSLGTTDGSEPTLCFFCSPENEASRADRRIWMDAADRVIEPTPPPTPKRWSGTVTIVDDDWERLDDRRVDSPTPKKKATDYYAILDEPDAFDERAWLNFMGAEYAIEHIDGATDTPAA